jgi:hypothetical protein
MIDDDECGAVGGIRIGRGNRSTRRKPDPVPELWDGQTETETDVFLSRDGACRDVNDE